MNRFALLNAVAVLSGTAACAGGASVPPARARRGRIDVGTRISPTGAVCSATLLENELGGGVGGCVVNVFRGTTYPAPRGGCVDAKVPMSFARQGGEP